MKSCEQYELLASLVLDGEATRAEQAELAAHLETCPACRAYFADIKRIHGALAREEIVVPEGFGLRVMDRVRETAQDRPEEHKKVIPFPRWRRWAALAACCAVAALSVWTFQWRTDAKDDAAAADNKPRMEAEASMRAADALPAAQEPEEPDDAADGDGEAPEALPQSVPEEYSELAKSAVKDSGGEGDYMPVTGSQSEPGAVLAASPPPEDTAAAEEDALPAPEGDSPDNAEPKDSAEDAPAPEEQPGGESGPEAAAPEAPEAPAPEEGSLDETEEEVEPVEVIGVPEPGILIAYGNAAQAWVEDVLGLEWAIGGSYPLTAEQYSDLQRTLDEAGEDYTVADGKGYCLMTE